MAQILKGLPVADAITQRLIYKTKDLIKKGIFPTLAIVRVGEREDDIAYEKGMMKRCEKVGIIVKQFLIPENASKKEVIDIIVSINEDSEIHGCLMFRPLPDKDTEIEAGLLLDPKKDVDCMGRASLAKVFSGTGEGYPPCTAEAVIELLKHYGYELSGKRVCVVGRSLVIGKPVSMMLQSENATVTMCHTRTVDLAKTCRDAEILVVCAGKAKIVGESFVSPGQVVIDVGINVDEEGQLCGDVNFGEVEPIVSAVTPVPAGVGSVTTAVCASHVIDAAAGVR